MAIDYEEWAKFIQEADLTGCDLESAKSIATAYQQVFERYPQLKGKFDPPDAHPYGMKDNTYAWCQTYAGGKVQVNPNRFNNWDRVSETYKNDVLSGWHPKGTTAESVVTHEIGHAIDGLLERKGVLVGTTDSGKYVTASSSLKTTVMDRAAKLDPNIADTMATDRQTKGSRAVAENVSRYATKNSEEWFAECFSEYMTSSDPRIVASEFGKELEVLMRRIS